MAEVSDFAEFYRVSFAPLCGQLHAHTGDAAEAQDVVQEAFCRAYARWDRISRYEDPVAWVRKVAWNLATSRWRKVRSGWTHVQRSREEHIPAPDAGHLDVMAALKELPERQRQAVVLHYFSDIPVAEIAALTGAAEGTVKSWLHRARTTLDGQLRAADWPGSTPPGVEATRKTARKRRDLRTVAGVVILLLLAAAIYFLPTQLPQQPPVIEITPSPSVFPTGSASPSEPVGAGVVQPSAAAGCVSDPEAYVRSSSGTSVLIYWLDHRTHLWQPMCPGVKLKVIWASYTLDAELNATLHQTGEIVLEGSRKEATVNVVRATGCNAWYVVRDVPVPPYIDHAWAGTSHGSSPFYDNRRLESGVLISEYPRSCPTPTPSA